jgi:hypothetical protein
MMFLLVFRSAYGSPFWRLVEPFFCFLTMKDIAYLSRQVLQDYLILYQMNYALLAGLLIDTLIG